jgi:hypothetical protein
MKLAIVPCSGSGPSCLLLIIISYIDTIPKDSDGLLQLQLHTAVIRFRDPIHKNNRSENEAKMNSSNSSLQNQRKT